MSFHESEMLVLVCAGKAGSELPVRGSVEAAVDLAEARTAELLWLPRQSVRSVRADSARDWLRRVVCPVSIAEARARRLLVATMLLVRAVRTEQYLTELYACERSLQRILGSAPTLPDPAVETDVEQYAEAVMALMQQSMGPGHVAAGKLGADPSILEVLRRLADIASGLPYVGAPFLDLQQQSTVPPSPQDLLTRAAHGEDLWLVGLSVQKPG